MPLDLVTQVLFVWSPAQLRAIVALLHAALTACPATDPASGTEVCDARFAATAAVPLVHRASAAGSLVPPAVLLETLAIDLAAATAAKHPAPAQLHMLATTARAWFMVLLVMDGRVRRLAFAECAGLHGVLGACAPTRGRIAGFLGDGRAVQTVCDYLNDVDTLAAAGDTGAVARQTEHFVAFMASWWVSGAPVPPLAWDASLGGVLGDRVAGVPRM